MFGWGKDWDPMNSLFLKNKSLVSGSFYMMGAMSVGSHTSVQERS